MQHQYQIILREWWGKESALFDEKCLLYQLKNKLIQRLLSEGILSLDDLDDRNRTPHVRVTDKKLYPKDQQAYDTINNKIMTISLKDIQVHKDWIDVPVGHSGRVDAHVTLVYKKNIMATKTAS